MTEEVARLTAEIKLLNDLANEAYHRRDLALEQMYDDQAKPLKQRLHELTWLRCKGTCADLYPSSEIDDAGFCYQDSDKSVHQSHHFDPTIWTPNQRCSRCQVKHYHHRAHWPCGSDSV